MKNQKGLFYGLTAVAVAALIIGLNQFSNAAQNNAPENTNLRQGNMLDGRGQGKMMKGYGQNRMTDEERATFEEEREVRRQAVEAAVNANDYEAWVKAAGDDCPMADKVNKDNFSKFAEAHRLRQAADKIMTELGIEKMGRGFGGQHGLGR